MLVKFADLASAAITAVVKTVQIGTVKAMQDTMFHQGYLDIWAR